MVTPVGFCTHCGVDIESWEGLTCCPTCGTTGVPCAYADQHDVSVNLHELRVLCLWAENWALHCTRRPNLDEASKAIHMDEVVYAIAGRLLKQLPAGSALTMAGEFKELKDSGYKFETNHPAADNPDTGESFTGS
jgi:hypothetical protein